MKIRKKFPAWQRQATHYIRPQFVLRMTASIFLLCLFAAGCESSGADARTARKTKAEVRKQQRRLLALEWQISGKWAETFGIATAPVVPGRRQAPAIWREARLRAADPLGKLLSLKKRQKS